MTFASQSALLACLALSFLLFGCSGSHFQRAAKSDTAESWRAFLHSGAGDDEQRDYAGARYDDLVWEETKSIDNIAAYRRYLEAVSGGKHSSEAKARLETLRFAKARSSNNLHKLEEFMAVYAGGAHDREARELLLSRRFQLAGEADTVEEYRRFLNDFPDAPQRLEVEALLELSSLQKAIATESLDAIETHRRRFSDGRLAQDADAYAAILKVRARVLAGDEDAALRIVFGTGGEARHDLEAAYLQASLQRAALFLDIDTMRALAEEIEDPDLKRQVLERANKLDENPDIVEIAKKVSIVLSADTGLNPEIIVAGLVDQDARRRRVCVRALGYAANPDAIQPLVVALSDRNLGVRSEAVRSLLRLGASLDPLIRDVFYTEALAKLDTFAADPHPVWMAAVLLDAAGHTDRAIRAYQRAAASEGQILAQLRLARTEPESRRRHLYLSAPAKSLIEAIGMRVESMAGNTPDTDSKEAARHDTTLLRHLPALMEHLEESISLAQQHNHDIRFAWLEDAGTTLDRARHLLLDAEARLKQDDPSWIPYGFDEGEEAREDAGENRAEAVEALLRFSQDLEELAPLFEIIARSPHEEETAVLNESMKREGETPTDLKKE